MFLIRNQNMIHKPKVHSVGCSSGTPAPPTAALPLKHGQAQVMGHQPPWESEEQVL